MFRIRFVTDFDGEEVVKEEEHEHLPLLGFPITGTDGKTYLVCDRGEERADGIEVVYVCEKE